MLLLFCDLMSSVKHSELCMIVETTSEQSVCLNLKHEHTYMFADMLTCIMDRKKKTETEKGKEQLRTEQIPRHACNM